MRLTAIGARDAAKVRAILPSGLSVPPEVVGVTDLAAHADIVIECAPAALLCSIAEPVLRAGRTMVVLSCGALLDAMHLVELARTHGGRILVPTGALLGLDAVFAAAQGTIHTVRMITRKPPKRSKFMVVPVSAVRRPDRLRTSGPAIRSVKTEPSTDGRDQRFRQL